MKAMRNQPRKMAPIGMATAQAGATLSLPTVAKTTANAVMDTVKKNLGNFVIARSVSISYSTSLSFQFADFRNSLIDAVLRRGFWPFWIGRLGAKDLYFIRFDLQPGVSE